MKHSDDITEFSKAFVKAQAAIKGAVKDSANPFFKSSYADLTTVYEAVKEALHENGIAVLQGGVPSENENIAAFTTRLIHESGQWIESTLEVPLIKKDPQSLGSCFTYARRYSLAAMTGVPLLDDDAEGAMGRDKTNKGDDPYLQSAGGVVASPPDQENYSKEKAGMKSDVLALADACGLKGHNQVATFRNISKALGMAISSTETLERLATIKDALEDLLERRNTGNLTESELKVIGV